MRQGLRNLWARLILCPCRKMWYLDHRTLTLHIRNDKTECDVFGHEWLAPRYGAAGWHVVVCARCGKEDLA